MNYDIEFNHSEVYAELSDRNDLNRSHRFITQFGFMAVTCAALYYAPLVANWCIDRLAEVTV